MKLDQILNFQEGKLQVIDLYEEGFDKEMLETVKPSIQMSENYTRRSDASSIFYMKTFLISETFELVDSLSHTEELQKFPCPWHLVSHTFPYSTIRYIIYYHAGKVIVLNLNFDSTILNKF